ncbi:MAG TPA: hypothetical protein VLG10_04285 [Methylomirabilota bacterium]|nr:hypothetical protein [Methylomirabilota bacterium]
MQIGIKAILSWLLVLALTTPGGTEELSGQLLDAATGRVIASAHVTSNGQVVRTDGQGIFRLSAAGDTVRDPAARPRR